MKSPNEIQRRHLRIGTSSGMETGITRKAQSNRWHTLLAASLVVAYEDEHDLYVSTRRSENLYRAGVTTRLTQWLDSCVENDLLVTQSPTSKAEGRLALGAILTYYLAQTAAA
jgi:hypothetical protein